MTRFDSSALDDLRGRALKRLVPRLIHDVHNRTFHVRTAIELASVGRPLLPHAELLANLDEATALLTSLSRFSSGSHEDGPVELAEWTAEFERFAAPACRHEGVELHVDRAATAVVVGDLWSVLTVFLAVVAEHVGRGAAPIKLWIEREGETIEIGLSIDVARPELAELVREVGVVQVGSAGGGLVLSARFEGGVLSGDRPAEPSGARVLVLEPQDPYGALTGEVLRDAGHRAVGATPDDEGLSELLAATWDLVLFDRRLEDEHPALLGTLEASSQRVRFLGDGGLAVPFDPQSLLRFVEEALPVGG